ncbi:MAG: flagellar biosynthetic protein FliO [Bacillota bacterium]
MNYSWEIIKMIFYLLLVLGIIYLLTRFLKNRFFQPRGGSNIKIIEQVYLAPKKSLKLIKIRDKIILIGISGDKIEVLSEWSSSEFGPLAEEENDNNELGTRFSSYFNKFKEKYRRDDHE